ncbi:TPA: ead/Ea22-like family protein [Klebsiella pneumoniae]
MTTDITELAPAMKAAAKKATPGPWALARNGKTVVSNQSHPIANVTDVMHRMLADGTTGQDAEFISLANPANILALVEALEKAQAQSSKWLEAYHKAVSIGARYEERIAELESRTVTVKLASRRLPSDYVDGEFGNDDLAAIHNACRLECKVSVEKYLSAHGIVVKWEAE